MSCVSVGTCPDFDPALHVEAPLPIEDHPELQCGLLRITYAPETRTVKLYLPWGECTDMCGAIAVAKWHNPEVQHVQTIAGDEPDTWYRLIGGEWHSYYPEAMLSVLGRLL